MDAKDLSGEVSMHDHMICPCHRGGCSVLCCHRYSKEYGYICDKCYSELKSRCSNVREKVLLPITFPIVNIARKTFYKDKDLGIDMLVVLSCWYGE